MPPRIKGNMTNISMKWNLHLLLHSLFLAQMALALKSQQATCISTWPHCYLQTYSLTIMWLRCHLTFSLLQSSIMYIWGAHSHHGHYVSTTQTTTRPGVKGSSSKPTIDSTGSIIIIHVFQFLLFFPVPCYICIAEWLLQRSLEIDNVCTNLGVINVNVTVQYMIEYIVHPACCYTLQLYYHILRHTLVQDFQLWSVVLP